MDKIPIAKHHGLVDAHIRRSGADYDWILIGAAIPLVILGLITMDSFTGETNFFSRQLIWILVSAAVFMFVSRLDFRVLRSTWVSVTLFIASCTTLGVLSIIGKVAKGAQSWFDLGLFSIQPADPIKLALIIILAKYFSRRHMEIANIRHIIVSGFYAAIIFILVAVQPDFGSAIIMFFLWLGMVLVSGIKKQHIMAVVIAGSVVFLGLWSYGFKDYQKNRIKTFLNPIADIHGAGYNVNQSIIAVGSGQFFGKGVGYGTQSRLKFLPEYQTDFIVAAYLEEWGFLGFLIISFLYSVVVWRIIMNAIRGETNFEILFGAGLAMYFIAHYIINIGMNLGIMPVTGIAMPFMSYGGTHILTEFTGIGMLVAMRRYSRLVHKESILNEYLGPK